MKEWASSTELATLDEPGDVWKEWLREWSPESFRESTSDSP